MALTDLFRSRHPRSGPLLVQTLSSAAECLLASPSETALPVALATVGSALGCSRLEWETVLQPEDDDMLSTLRHA